MKDGSIVIQKKHILLAIAVVLLLLSAALILGLNWNNWFAVSDGAQPSGPDIDPNAGTIPGLVPPASGDSVGIQIPGYPSILLAADTQDVAVALVNPDGNPCYFIFELVLKDGGESLYTSKLVPPGQAITHITLSRALAAGNYDATLKITTFSLTDQTPMNGANVETVLIVQ